MNHCAFIIIAGGRRTQLIDKRILPSLPAGYEALVVGEHHEGISCRYLHIPALTHTTVDALVKRDVGALATDAEWIFYLSDDHGLGRQFANWIGELSGYADVIVPGRFCRTNGHHVALNMGMEETDPNHFYCAGHGGMFRRSLIVRRPWSTMPHHPLWDLLASRIQMKMGAVFAYAPEPAILEDLTPETEPWK